MADSNFFTSLFNSLLNTPQYIASPALQGSHVHTYLSNILIQCYAYLASYPSMGFILPALTRFRTVIDYRLTHEYFHLHEKAERQHYFQGLLTTSLNAYFATMIVSVLLGQPVSFLLTSTPLYITWFIYTLLWFIPIKVLFSISRYCRWIPATAGIIFESLLCIFTIERAMRVSYQSQPTITPVSSIGNAFDEVDPTSLLRITSAISIPFALLCGFLIVQGNGLLAEMINIHGNFKVKTPTQVKNPFVGTGKISLNMALFFVSFVTLFVPAHIFLAGAKNAPPNLLPIVQVSHNNFNGAVDTEEICISQQHRISQVCYQDWMLSWCADHIPKTMDPGLDGPGPGAGSGPGFDPTGSAGISETAKSTSSFESVTSPFASIYSDIICDTTLSLIHILGLTDCDLEQQLPSVASLVSKQHETHQAASKAITARLHHNILADGRDIRRANKKQRALNKAAAAAQRKRQQEELQSTGDSASDVVVSNEATPVASTPSPSTTSPSVLPPTPPRTAQQDQNQHQTHQQQSPHNSTATTTPTIAPVTIAKPFAHIYPTIPIDQVGQPLVARVIRETLGSRIDFYSRGIRGVMKTIGFGIRHVAQFIGECFERVIPIQHVAHLHPQPHFHCTPLAALSELEEERPGGGSGGGAADSRNQLATNPHHKPFLVPTLAFHSLAQTAIPPDTLFFVHVPATDGRTVNVFPITFTLVKALMVLVWFVVHWVYLFTHTRFQSKCAAKLANIWWPKNPTGTASSGLIPPLGLSNSKIAHGRLGLKPRTPTLPKLAQPVVDQAQTGRSAPTGTSKTSQDGIAGPSPKVKNKDSTQQQPHSTPKRPPPTPSGPTSAKSSGKK